METSKAMNLSLLIFRWLILVGGLPWMLSASRKVSFPWLVTVGQSLVILGSKYDLEVEWIWVLKLSALVSIEMSVCGRQYPPQEVLETLFWESHHVTNDVTLSKSGFFFFAFLKENFIGGVFLSHTHTNNCILTLLFQLKAESWRRA